MTRKISTLNRYRPEITPMPHQSSVYGAIAMSDGYQFEAWIGEYATMTSALAERNPKAALGLMMRAVRDLSGNDNLFQMLAMQIEGYLASVAESDRCLPEEMSATAILAGVALGQKFEGQKFGRSQSESGPAAKHPYTEH